MEVVGYRLRRLTFSDKILRYCRDYHTPMAVWVAKVVNQPRVCSVIFENCVLYLENPE